MIGFLKKKSVTVLMTGSLKRLFNALFCCYTVNQSRASFKQGQNRCYKITKSRKIKILKNLLPPLPREGVGHQILVTEVTESIYPVTFVLIRPQAVPVTPKCSFEVR